MYRGAAADGRDEETGGEQQDRDGGGTPTGVLGITLLVLLLARGWWLARRRRDLHVMASLLWACVGTVVAVGVNQPFVNAVAERRPYQSLPHVLVLVGRSGDYGFPSEIRGLSTTPLRPLLTAGSADMTRAPGPPTDSG